VAGSELRCAVLGKFGLQAASGLYGDADTNNSLPSDAQRSLSCNALARSMDDEPFPREGQLDLFESLGSAEKVCPE
jgi:hypothetical protein